MLQPCYSLVLRCLYPGITGEVPLVNNNTNKFLPKNRVLLVLKIHAMKFVICTKANQYRIQYHKSTIRTVITRIEIRRGATPPQNENQDKQQVGLHPLTMLVCGMEY